MQKSRLSHVPQTKTLKDAPLPKAANVAPFFRILSGARANRGIPLLGRYWSFVPERPFALPEIAKMRHLRIPLATMGRASGYCAPR